MNRHEDVAATPSPQPPVNKVAVALAARDAMRAWRKGKLIAFQARRYP